MLVLEFVNLEVIVAIMFAFQKQMKKYLSFCKVSSIYLRVGTVIKHFVSYTSLAFHWLPFSVLCIQRLQCFESTGQFSNPI